ncbi:MAG: hypothetical protein ACREQ9_25650 [Candidatus Binatia bacterium]
MRTVAIAFAAVLGVLAADATAAEKCHLLLSDCIAANTPACERRHPRPEEAAERERCLADCNLCEDDAVCIRSACCPLERACPDLDRCCGEGKRCSLDGECVKAQGSRSAAPPGITDPTPP